MTGPKKTLRLPSHLPDGKRTTPSETAAKPPRSHKPWSQALAKKRSPRVVTETMSAKEALIKSASEMKRKAPGAQQPRHIKTIGEVASTAQRSDSLAQPLNQHFPKDSSPNLRAFSGSPYTEKRKDATPSDRRAPPRSDARSDGRSDWRSDQRPDRRPYQQGNPPDSFRASQPAGRRSSDGTRRFGADSRDTASRGTTSYGVSSRQPSSEFREERPFNKTPRDEKTWRSRSENGQPENRPRYDKKVFGRQENTRTWDGKTANARTERTKETLIESASEMKREAHGAQPFSQRPPKTFAKKAVPPSPPLEGVRVSKLLANRGLCSRREADEYIERGWVRVNGQRVALGARAQPDDDITLLPQAKKQQARQVTVLLHKPIGYVSGQPEPGYRPAITLITPENQWPQEGDPSFSAAHLRHLAPAGRLDIDSTGLLVLTQDGRVARELIGETSSIDKEYLVRVEGVLSDENLALLNHGLSLDGEALKPARVEWINDDQLRFVLREGKKRQIRRMCEAVGLAVTGLKRVRIGHVRLGDLPPGQWRYLRDDESFDYSER